MAIGRVFEHRSAKVVLLGDSGVGKSGLALRLAGSLWRPTDSTHQLMLRSIKISPHGDEAGREVREIVLWDVGGGRGYRVLQQLSLQYASIIVVAFDAAGEADPIARIQHWTSITERIVQRRTTHGPGPRRFLVATRADRGGMTVSMSRVEELVTELGFDGFFQTSARQGAGIANLSRAIHSAIDWDTTSSVHSSGLADVETMLAERRTRGEILIPWPDLEAEWIARSHVVAGSMVDGALAELAAALQTLEIQGVARGLANEGLLVAVEWLDEYVGALVAAAHEDPHRQGALEETRVTRDALSIVAYVSSDDTTHPRIEDAAQERAVVAAIIALLLQRELIVRVATPDGSYLVFPSERSQNLPALSDAEGASLVFEFEGAIERISSVLITQIAHSGWFSRRDVWRNAATFVANDGGVCGLMLRALDRDHGEVILFFDGAATAASQTQFAEHVHQSLLPLAAPQSIVRKSPFICHSCGYQVPDDVVAKRHERGSAWLSCPVCGSRISLVERGPRAETDRFDVFLVYSAQDRDAVVDVAQKLVARGLRPWLDAWQLRPGAAWVDNVSLAISSCRSAAVFVGPHGPGAWADLEMSALLARSVERQIPIIPILLPGTERPELPAFLRPFNWVDLREDSPGELDRLAWGITGSRSAVTPANAHRPPFEEREHALGLTLDEGKALDIVTEVRNAAGLGVTRDPGRLARALARLLGATDLTSIHVTPYAPGTTWEMNLPKIGLRLTTQLAVMLVRQVRDQVQSTDRLHEHLVRRNPQFVLFVDLADGLSVPTSLSAPVLRLDPALLLELVTIPPTLVPSWLGRVIAHQVDITPMLPYSARGATTEMFFGRDQELRRLLGKDLRGGIILGVHGSGKSSLLHRLRKQLIERGRTVVGPITLTESKRRFFEQTLKGLQLEIGRGPTAATWANRVRAFSRSSSPPVFLLDEADFLIKQDARSRSALGSEIRALQEERLATFYLAGHLELRAATLRYRGPFRNFAEEVTLKGLTEKAATRLICDPIVNLGFAIHDAQAKRIYRGTAGMAALIQEFCSRLLVAQRDATTTEITDAAIEHVERTPSYLDQTFHYFYNYDETTLSRAVFLIVAIERRVNRAALARILRQAGARVSREQIDQSLALLSSFGILDEYTAGSYRLPALYLERAAQDRHPQGLLDEELKKLRRRR